MAEPQPLPADIQQKINPFVSGIYNADEGQKKMLDAVVAAGEAGRKEFTAAQQAGQAAQQAAVQRAAEAERVAGLGVPQMGQANIVNTYGQHANVLANRQADFHAGLEGTKASGVSYFEKLKAATPLLEAVNKGKIDQREKEIQAMIAKAEAEAKAKAEQEAAKLAAEIARENAREQREVAREERKAAREKAEKFPKSQVIGATEIAVQRANALKPGLQTELDKVQGDYDRAQKVLDTTNKDIAALEKKMNSAKWQGAYRIGDRKAIEERGRYDMLVKGRDTIAPKQQERLGQISTYRARIQEIDDMNADPTELSRSIAINQFGRDPNEAFGELTANTWQDIIEASKAGSARKQSPEAQQLASKLKIDGGAAKVAEILNMPQVQQYILDIEDDLTSGATKADVLDALAKNWLDPKGKSRSVDYIPKYSVPQRRTYDILKELINGYGWPKEK